MADAVGSSSIG